MTCQSAPCEVHKGSPTPHARPSTHMAMPLVSRSPRARTRRRASSRPKVGRGPGRASCPAPNRAPAAHCTTSTKKSEEDEVFTVRSGHSLPLWIEPPAALRAAHGVSRAQKTRGRNSFEDAQCRLEEGRVRAIRARRIESLQSMRCPMRPSCRTEGRRK